MRIFFVSTFVEPVHYRRALAATLCVRMGCRRFRRGSWCWFFCGDGPVAGGGFNSDGRRRGGISCARPRIDIRALFLPLALLTVLCAAALAVVSSVTHVRRLRLPRTAGPTTPGTRDRRAGWWLRSRKDHEPPSANGKRADVLCRRSDSARFADVLPRAGAGTPGAARCVFRTRCQSSCSSCSCPSQSTASVQAQQSWCHFTGAPR